MKLAILLVSYNTRDLLRTCLRSVFASLHGAADLDVVVVVVDSASQDGSADMVATEFPQVQLVRCTDNVGFTHGNNLALHTLGFQTLVSTPQSPASNPQSGRPHFVLLLNPDTEIVGDALIQMVRFLEITPDAGVCGAHLRYGDGRFQHGAFRFPSLAQVLLDLFPLAELPLLHRLYDSPVNGRFHQILWQGETPFPVDFVLGATMMVRAEAIQRVGGLDEGYFMYCEEMDWCLRIQEAGWQVYALPTAQVVHHEGQSSKQIRWQAYEWLWRSRLRFYRRYPQRYSRVHRWALHFLVWLGMKWRAWRAYRHFLQGKTNGVALAQELATYTAIITQLTKQWLN